MSDFSVTIPLLRHQMVNALEDNPEQALWVFSELASTSTIDEFASHIEVFEHDATEVAQFWRDFADLIDPEGQEQ